MVGLPRLCGLNLFHPLSAGAQYARITYLFTRTCAVEGSTVLLPCSFTPLKSFIKDGINVPLKIIRVRWCRNHPICQGDTPSVFDSDSLDVDPQFQYLGDMEGKCTLQISNIQLKDEATYRFRMEADHLAGHFTNQTGVTVQVEGNPVMRVAGSNNSEVREGQTVSLQCSTSPCSFHRVNISWFRDDHALPEAGPTLHLGPLTAKDSGNYSCALGTRTQSRSDPFSLQVEADSEGGGVTGETSHRILGVAVAVLVVVIALAALMLFLVIKSAAMWFCRLDLMEKLRGQTRTWRTSATPPFTLNRRNPAESCSRTQTMWSTPQWSLEVEHKPCGASGP
ncbi:uncharacterized protein LOC112136747 isoform X3 [Oryzias melastigma]|uniref:uncharacterized protein LOC112136747 isoform X3 n=1 Tax=Oryzias melastigma TaxID=30732 RepID=UPI00168CE8C9|nr:uncharacterized protein LOC112136747 isoform X3 [Oryzias melastigma]